jgi:threonine dehydratase
VAIEAAGADVALWCVEPTGAAAMHRSFQEGHAVHLDTVSTVADGLKAPMAGELNYEILRRTARGVALVDDAAIVRAMRLLLERTKLLAEPAGAAGLAAVLEGAVTDLRGPLVVLVSGGNVDAELLGRLLLADAG